MKTLLISWLKQAIQETINQAFTVESVKAVLEQALAWLKVKAAETSTSLDDYTLQYLETFILDEARINRFVQLIQQLAAAHQTSEGAMLCEAQPPENLCDEIAPLFIEWANH